jgi:hypothetical protein
MLGELMRGYRVTEDCALNEEGDRPIKQSPSPQATLSTGLKGSKFS